MKRKPFLLLLLVFVTAMPIAAQQHLADSIETVLKKDLPDSVRAVALINKAMYYETIDSAKSKQFYKEAIDYAVKRKLNYAAGLALHYSIYVDLAAGKYKEHINDIDKSLYYLSLSNSEAASVQSGLVMDSKASFFFQEEQYDSAANWYLKSIAMLEKIKKDDRLATTYFNLAGVYQMLNLRDKQKEYILKALDASKRYRQASEIASMYSALSDYYHTGKEYKTALLYSDSAGLYFSEGIDMSKKYYFFAVRGQAFSGMKKYDSTVYYYKKGNEIAKALNNVSGITETTIWIGSAYLGLKQYSNAEKFIKEGIALAETNDYMALKTYGYELLSKYYEETGDYKQSLTAYKKYVETNDSLQNADRKKTILDLDKKYETEKKEKQLILQKASIKQKNILNYILGGSIAALLLISLLSYRTYTQKRKLQEQKIAELEKEKLLSATQSLLKGQEDERSRLAKDLHDGLGGLLSGVKLQLGAMKGNLILSEEHGRTFNNALGKLDESISEMRRVAHNMMPEALMKLGLQQALQDYCDGLSESQSFKINCEFHALEKRMPSSTEIVVYRIVQELLNNAVKHSEASVILAQVIRHGDNLSITVEDNGKGFDIAQSTFSKGAGLKNIQSRVDYLKGQLDIKSTVGKGTSVHIDCIIDENG